MELLLDLISFPILSTFCPPEELRDLWKRQMHASRRTGDEALALRRRLTRMLPRALLRGCVRLDLAGGVNHVFKAWNLIRDLPNLFYRSGPLLGAPEPRIRLSQTKVLVWKQLMPT
jgi:hypothetical protein